MFSFASCSRTTVACLLIFGSVGGCAKDLSFSSTPGGEKVTITVKVPKDLITDSMHVMYRSSICKRIAHDSNGRPEPLDGYNGYEMELKRAGNDDTFTAQLFVDGGGPCEWHLSNVRFGVSYPVPNVLGEDVIEGAGGNIIVVFDHNNPQLQTGYSWTAEGPDLNVVKDYYPWIHESYIRGHQKWAMLADEEGGTFTYEAREARNIYFEPVLHRDYVVRSAEPTKHKRGDYITFVYPDGTKQFDGRAVPDFEKMQNIRLKAIANK
jgi:hypothetical protein